MPLMDKIKRMGFEPRFDGAGLIISGADTGLEVFNSDRYIVFPGFCDVHVHFREPGFSYKGTIKDGALAAAHGGYTSVCAMPNLNPVPDSVEHMQEELDIIKRDACIDVYPYAAITVGEAGEKLVDMEALSGTAVAFSDDGKGVQDAGVMREAMSMAKACGKMIVAHCEVNSLLHGGYIHDGEYARTHGHAGISSESEWREIERDVRLADDTGCAYHVCHISTRESVQIIRDAKKSGVNVTCETAPHYLLLDDSRIEESGRFKMNPPLRSPSDREAMIEGVIDGTVDMIATDHAPHAAIEKDKGLKNSANGIVGLETAFSECYTGLVKTGIISLEKLVSLLTANPRRRFNIPDRNGIGQAGGDSLQSMGGITEIRDYTIWDLGAEYTLDPAGFLSKGKATPFEGDSVFGKCMLTVCDGRIVYRDAGIAG